MICGAEGVSGSFNHPIRCAGRDLGQHAHLSASLLRSNDHII